MLHQVRDHSTSTEVVLPAIPVAVSPTAVPNRYHKFLPAGISSSTDHNQHLVTDPSNNALVDAVSIDVGPRLVSHLKMGRGKGIDIGENSWQEGDFAENAPLLAATFFDRRSDRLVVRGPWGLGWMRKIEDVQRRFVRSDC